MKKNNRFHLAFIARVVFIGIFAFLTLHGMIASKDSTSYNVRKNPMPVISLTVEASGNIANENEDSVFVIGNADNVPAVSAQAAALICADDSRVLYLKNGDMPLPMASTTKIMTALVAIETLPQDAVITITPDVCGIEGSSIYLVPGEKLTVRDLLYGLLLESGNDAAAALAKAGGNSEEEFVSLMNSRASEMGLKNTRFANPHGLSSENHYTTAHELAIITYHAMKNPLFAEIVATKNYTVYDEKGTAVKYFSNHNRLLRSYSGANGVKTGYTLLSGRCLVTSAKRDGTAFIAVTLNDRNDFADHARLHDFAFASFKTIRYAPKGTLSFTIGGQTFKNPDNLCRAVRISGESNFDLEVTLVCDDTNDVP